MYYVYWLKWQYWTNFVLSDSDNPHYNCHKTLKGWGTHEEMCALQCLLARMHGGIWYPRCPSTFVYKDNIMNTRRALAHDMGISRYALHDRLKAYRLWLRQWPDDLTEFIDGRETTRPKIVRGRLVGENKIYEHVLRGY